METLTHSPQSSVIWDIDGIPSGMTCASCGGRIDVNTWQPRIRCPHCDTLGYPDRSGRNLLPRTWTCHNCGAQNDGSLNFCLTCGSGLASRCPRCEQPVYSAVCNACGAHLSHLLRLESVEARREEWVPILRERVRQEKAREELEANRHYNPTYGVTEWRAIDRQMREAAQQRQQKFADQRAGKRARRRRFWGIVGVLGGLIWLIAANYEYLSPFVNDWIVSLRAWYVSAIQPSLEVALAWLTVWWGAFAASLGQPFGPEDEGYSYVFATIIFGIALLPVLIFLLGRLVRRLFP
jgi:predicted RNA-binding Zn-ribbon protein involved in translation (DUF1610 family)